MSTTNKQTGGHAFPCEIDNGMTLRDYFAGKALSGMLANSGGDGDQRILDQGARIRRSDARIAYAYADAMLEARKA